jgi:MFS family permease
MYRVKLHSRYVRLSCSCLIGRFFFHEHARKIGIWGMAFVISPFLGPFLSGIISNSESWRVTFWIEFMIVGLALTYVALLGEETLYDRDNVDVQPPKPTGYLNHRFQMLTGIYGAKCKGRTTLWKSTQNLIWLPTRPYFFCLCSRFPFEA